MLEVKFYDTVEDEKLKFAVILSKYQDKWIFCKHKERDTWEIPGGHREPDESILETARRELQEETGAAQFTIRPVCVYSVTGQTRVNQTGEETFGMLYYAEVTAIDDSLHSEMEKVTLSKELPEHWTYPLIQPKLVERFVYEEAIKTAYEALKRADYEEAVQCLGAVEQIGQEEFLWNYRLGLAFFCLEEFRLSQAYIQRAVSIRPEDKEASVLLEACSAGLEEAMQKIKEAEAVKQELFRQLEAEMQSDFWADAYVDEEEEL